MPYKSLHATPKYNAGFRHSLWVPTLGLFYAYSRLLKRCYCRPIQLSIWGMLRLLTQPHTYSISNSCFQFKKLTHVHWQLTIKRSFLLCIWAHWVLSFTIDQYKDLQWMPFVLFRGDSSTRLDSNSTTTGVFTLLSSFTNLPDDAK